MYTQYDDELRHYGVLGMKWGIRRARAKGTTYSYKSRATKRYENKAANAINAEQRKTYTNMAKRSAKMDKSMENSVRASSAGKTTAKVLLNGLWGAKTYEAAKAAGYSKAGSEILTLAGAYLGGPLGNMATTALIRHDYVRGHEGSF